jgi:hypothetical protein
LAAFLAFLFFAITGLHQWLKEAKHEARPYCDGLFDRRKNPGTPNLVASRRVERAAQKKSLPSIFRNLRKVIREGLHIIRKAARAI